MADVDELKEAKKFYTDTPQKTEGFFLKGSNSLDWGMKNRLSRIFNPRSGRTVMLAIDHGYFQGPTTGLERIDLNILPLVPYADTLMLTRGILRSIVPPTASKSIVLRVSGGTSILKELSNEELAVDIEEHSMDFPEMSYDLSSAPPLASIDSDMFFCSLSKSFSGSNESA